MVGTWVAMFFMFESLFLVLSTKMTTVVGVQVSINWKSSPMREV